MRAFAPEPPSLLSALSSPYGGQKASSKDLETFPAMRLITILGLLIAALLTGACKQGETAVDRATREGILIMGNTSEPKGLDPHIVSGVLESNIIRALFEGLVVGHPSKDGVALPGVAEKWYPTDPQKPDEWVFELRKDASWSDGTPLTAEDFLFSFRRILSPSLASDYSFMLYYIEDAEPYHKSQRSYLTCRNDESFPVPWETLKKVDFGPNENGKTSFNKKGLDHLTAEQIRALQLDPVLFQWPEDVPPEVREILIQKNLEFADSGRELWELINFGASAPDPHTLRVKLNSPIAFLPEITKHYTWYPVPKHSILKHGRIGDRFTDWTKPKNIVSNGAFILSSWKFNDHIQVERNPRYWDSDNVGINGIRYLPISNLYTEDRMYFDGQMHVTYTLAPELIEYARQRYPDQVRNELYLGTYFIRANVTREPFTDPRVRMAFSKAIDQQSLITNVLKGGQKPAGGLVPPFGEYRPAKTVGFDPEGARRLLAEAGYPGGAGIPEIEFLTTDKETSKANAEALQAMWKDNLGVSIRIRQMEWTSYITTMFEKDYGLAAGGWIGDYLDPLTFLDMWMKDGGNNRTGWHNEEFEALLKKAGNTGDPQERYRVLEEAEALFLSESPILPLYWYTRNYLIHPDVKGWDPLILDNHPYKFLRLERASNPSLKNLGR